MMASEGYEWRGPSHSKSPRDDLVFEADNRRLATPKFSDPGPCSAEIVRQIVEFGGFPSGLCAGLSGLHGATLTLLKPSAQV